MINASLNIAWSIAEIEASAAGFQAILPNHFWIGCCKGCDLDYEKFLQNAYARMMNQLDMCMVPSPQECFRTGEYPH